MKPMINPNQEYQGQTRYHISAQKITEHIEKLNDDPLNRTRWIWELIQNAKDVSNEFGKVKIRFIIKNKNFKCMHNGNPFNAMELQRLVYQYSGKPEENNAFSNGTEKYGTGFMTTYMISKVVKIKGLIKIIEEAIDKSSSLDSLDSESDSPRVDKKAIKVPICAARQFQQDMSMISNISGGEEFEMDHRPMEGDEHFQEFRLLLDRNYKQKNKDFVKKIIKSEKNFEQILRENQKKPAWRRAEDSFDTVFSYEKLDETSFQIIDEGIASLKSCLPYAFLFNKTIESIEVRDQRIEPKFLSFIFKRQEGNIKGGISISNVLYQQGERKKIISLGYLSKDDSIVAVPIQFTNDSRKILHVPSQVAKNFKQFPLIDCSDSGFNFVCSSKKFHLNEKKSDLLLSTLDGRPNKKCEVNWLALNDIYNLMENLSTKLSRFADLGMENLLHTPNDNYLSRFPDFQTYKFERNFLSIKSAIADERIINFRNGSIGQCRGLYFLHDRSDQPDRVTYSNDLNEAFYFLFGDYCTLPSNLHSDFYKKLNVMKQLWPQIQMKSFKDCIDIFKEMDYTVLAALLQTKENVFRHLITIYGFLQKYHPELLLNTDGMRMLLTNDFSLRENNPVAPIRVKKNLPIMYEIVATCLEIDINVKTIHEDLSNQFQHFPPYGIDQINQDYLAEFEDIITKPSKKLPIPQTLAFIGNFLSIFEIASPEQQIYDALNHEMVALDAEYFQQKPSLGRNELVLRQKYKKHFEGILLIYLNSIMTPGLTWETFSGKYMAGGVSQTATGIAWFNNVLAIFKERIACGLNRQMIFCLKADLYVLVTQLKPSYFANYPDEQDLQLLRACCPAGLQILQNNIPHQLTSFKILMGPIFNKITYRQLFDEVFINYEKWSEGEKLLLIKDYLSQFELQSPTGSKSCTGTRRRYSVGS